MNKSNRRLRRHRHRRQCGYAFRAYRVLIVTTALFFLGSIILPLSTMIYSLKVPAFAMESEDENESENTVEFEPIVSIASTDSTYLPTAGAMKSEKESILPVAGIAAVLEYGFDENALSEETSDDANESSSVEQEKEPVPENDWPVEPDVTEKETEEFLSDLGDIVVQESVVTENVEETIPSVYLEGLDIELTDEFLSLCAMVHYEAGEGATVESKVAVGQVAMNRLKDSGKWGHTTLTQVLYADGQFNVVNTKKFNSLKEKLLTGNWDEYMQSSVMAANLVYTGSELYDIPDDVQYFYGDPNKRVWGIHEYCFTIGGNSFFK